MDRNAQLDRLAGMDPLQRARYDAAVQRFHDTVATHRATFEAQLRTAKDAVDELHRRHDKRGDKAGGKVGEQLAGKDATRGRGDRRNDEGSARSGRSRMVAASGPVQSILNRGG